MTDDVKVTQADADAAIRTAGDMLMLKLRGRLMRAESTIRVFEKHLAFEVDGPCPICSGVEGCSHSLGERIAHTRLASQPQWCADMEAGLLWRRWYGASSGVPADWSGGDCYFGDGTEGQPRGHQWGPFNDNMVAFYPVTLPAAPTPPETE